MIDLETRERLTRVEVMVGDARDDIKEMLREFRDSTKALDERIGATEEAIKGAQVGWRVLMTVGTIAMGIAGMIGGLIVKLMPWLSTLPK